MLIWPNENETNVELVNNMRKIYGRRSIKTFKPWELSIIFRQIQRHFGDRKDISILDFGAGISPFGAYLNHVGYQPVTCLDQACPWPQYREMNTETYNEKYNASVRYVKTDITLNYDAEHDVIFSASVLEHIKEPERIKIMKALSKYLKSGGLLIHIVDYDAGVNFKELIDACGIPISYNPKITPGCEEFGGPPKYTWWIAHKGIRGITRVAFFNEKEK